MSRRPKLGRRASAGGAKGPRRPSASRSANLGLAISTLASLDGFSHKTLAVAARLNDKTLSEWKSGVIPQAGSLRKIAGALDCPIELIEDLAEYFDRYQRRERRPGHLAARSCPPGVAEAANKPRRREELERRLGQIVVEGEGLIKEIKERFPAENHD